MTKIGLIFDVDGTLCNSNHIAVQALKELLKNYPTESHPMIDEAFVSSCMGLTMDDWARAVLPHTPIEESRQFIANLSATENEMIVQTGTDLYPNVKEVFAQLSKDYHLYILSNCGIGYIESIIEWAQLEPYVDAHICFGDTGLDKPENLKYLIEQQQLDEYIYIGDTQKDQDCCKEANVPFIFASYGFGTSTNPEYTINNLNELPAVLKQWQSSK